MGTTHVHLGNLLLQSLPEDEQDYVLHRGELVDLVCGAAVYEAGAVIDSLYFPTNGLVSLLGQSQEGHTIELATVACEGFLGLPRLFGKATQPLRCLVQQPGRAYRVPAELLQHRHLLSWSHALQHYADYRMAELAQLALCNQFHTVPQRLCRWLLTASDRTSSARLQGTHETLSSLLGCSRPVVSKLVHGLRVKRYLRYQRGSLVLQNRRGLAAQACRCYRTLRAVRADYLVEIGASPDAACPAPSHHAA
jgi:CRP-like cAMP-binding protein